MNSKCYVLYKQPRQSFELIIIDIFRNEESAQKELERYNKYALHYCYDYYLKEYELK